VRVIWHGSYGPPLGAWGLWSPGPGPGCSGPAPCAVFAWVIFFHTMTRCSVPGTACLVADPRRRSRRHAAGPGYTADMGLESRLKRPAKHPWHAHGPHLASPLSQRACRWTVGPVNPPAPPPASPAASAARPSSSQSTGRSVARHDTNLDAYYLPRHPAWGPARPTQCPAVLPAISAAFGPPPPAAATQGPAPPRTRPQVCLTQPVYSGAVLRDPALLELVFEHLAVGRASSRPALRTLALVCKEWRDAAVRACAHTHANAHICGRARGPRHSRHASGPASCD
jgi:hypothetical protein